VSNYARKSGLEDLGNFLVLVCIAQYYEPAYMDGAMLTVNGVLEYREPKHMPTYSTRGEHYSMLEQIR
jgi:hypothetical protein